MKILIDIGHPAHVHYFKNLVKILELKGFSFYFTLRERDSTVALMDRYGFSYTKRGKGGKNIITKLLPMPLMVLKVWRAARKFKPYMFPFIAINHLLIIKKIYLYGIWSKNYSLLLWASCSISFYKRNYAQVVCARIP